MSAIRLACLLAALAFGPPAVAVDLGDLWPVEGSGKVVHDNRTADGFRGISLHTAVPVELRQGRPASVDIEADDNIVPLIRVRVRDGVLTIDDRRNYKTGRGKIVITAPRIESLKARGATAVTAKGLVAPRLRVDIAGAAAVSLATLTAEAIDIDAAGSATLKITGIVNDATLSIGGSSALQLRDLEAARVTINAGGSSMATLWAKERLVVRGGGSSVVRYRGEPEVESGMGGSATLGRVSSAK